MGNAAAKQLTCAIGGQELRWGMLVGGGRRAEEDKGVENGTTGIA